MSSRWTITDEFGNVRLDDADLPGIFTSLEISQDVELDEQEVKGRSGKSKQIVGYGDATISLTLTLTSDDDMTCYEKLEKIQAKFRSTDSAARPKIMNIYNVHVSARGVEKVIFKSFSTSEALGDIITATMTFEEYIPFVPVSKEKRAETPKTMAPNEPPAVSSVEKYKKGQEETAGKPNAAVQQQSKNVVSPAQPKSPPLTSHFDTFYSK